MFVCFFVGGGGGGVIRFQQLFKNSKIIFLVIFLHIGPTYELIFLVTYLQGPT